MKLRFLTTIACIATRVVLAVSGAEELSNIAEETKLLDNKLSRWNGSPFSMFPLGLQAQKLKKIVDGATATFQDQGNRPESDDKLVVAAANDALAALDAVITTVIAAREDFDKIPLGLPILFGILKTLQTSTMKMTKAIVEGASIGNVNKIKAMQDRAKAHFEKAMASFD
ncbi:hypothetical protein K4F52_004467 [Lecanicillium sp. MT-2017a]|nr:hypothetical protein K4F52_004467 [Lecanicillium sp. MT-2017a]